MSKDEFENFGLGNLGPLDSEALGPPGPGGPAAEAAEEESPAGKKREREEKKREPRERRSREPGEAEPLLARLSKASPYTVMLAASLAMIVVAIFCLLAELARYGFSVHAPT